MRSLFKKRVGRLVALAASVALCEGAASACVPPLLGEREPSREEIVRSVAQGAGAIVYGSLVRGPDHRRGPRFLVRHVYRGAVRPGQQVSLEVGWDVPAPRCFGMMVRPPVLKGRTGVAILSGREMHFLGNDQVALMLSLGLLVPGPHDR